MRTVNAANVTLPQQTEDRTPSPAEKRNRAIFVLSNLLIYFSAPVTYVGVMHAGLLNKFGTSATVANLPESAFLLGFLAPLLLASTISLDSAQRVITCSYGGMAVSLMALGVSLFAPVPTPLRIAALILQAVLTGVGMSCGQVYMLHCLRMGTPADGMAAAFKLAFAFGPLTGVAGSLLAQWILGGGIQGLPFPHNYAFLCFLYAPCMLGVALLGRGYRIAKIEDQAVPTTIAQELVSTITSYFRDRKLALACCVYFLFFTGLQGMSNTSLYAREALGRAPSELSGAILALRFGSKGAYGFILGSIAQRHGIRASLMGTLVPLILSMVWVSTVRGDLFLGTFALMGAAELGGIYIPGYVLAVSSPSMGARNLAVLTLATVASSTIPALHGALTDYIGFQASFLCAGLAGVSALYLASRLPKDTIGT